MAKFRRCRWCHRALVQKPTRADRQAQPHCAESRQCDWCEQCYQRRFAMIKHGLHPDTADPLPAPAIDDTQEFPAVDDGQP